MAGATNMADERVERRLSAIFAADIAGYSALMGAHGAVRDLKGHQAVVSRTPDGWRVRRAPNGHNPTVMLSVLQKTAIEQAIFLCSILGNKASWRGTTDVAFSICLLCTAHDPWCTVRTRFRAACVL